MLLVSCESVQSTPSDCCPWNAALPRTGTLIRIDCFEVSLVIIWLRTQTAEGFFFFFRRQRAYAGSVFKKLYVDMHPIVARIDKSDSMSRLTLLLSLSSTFHATVKLLDLQLLQAEAHGQAGGM